MELLDRYKFSVLGYKIHREPSKAETEMDQAIDAGLIETFDCPCCEFSERCSLPSHLKSLELCEQEIKRILKESYDYLILNY